MGQRRNSHWDPRRVLNTGKWFHLEWILHHISGGQETQQEKHWYSIIAFRKKIFGNLSKSSKGWRMNPFEGLKRERMSLWMKSLAWVLQEVSLQRVGCQRDHSQSSHDSRVVFFCCGCFVFQVSKDLNIYLGQGKEAKTEGTVENKQ